MMKGSENPQFHREESLEIREHSPLIFTDAQRCRGPYPRSHSSFWNWIPGSAPHPMPCLTRGSSNLRDWSSLTALKSLLSSVPQEPPEMQLIP